MKAFYTFMGSLLGVFVLFFVVLNLMLNAMVIKPLTRMAELANAVSTGHLELPEFPVRGKDEVSVLAQSFNRLRRSLEHAMRMVDEQ
jgi:protein-histidine pros-kinase